MRLHFECSAPQRSNLAFLIQHSGTLALSPECQSPRMSEIKNARLDLHMAKCDNLKTMKSWKWFAVTLKLFE